MFFVMVAVGVPMRVKQKIPCSAYVFRRAAVSRTQTFSIFFFFRVSDVTSENDFELFRASGYENCFIFYETFAQHGNSSRRDQS